MLAQKISPSTGIHALESPGRRSTKLWLPAVLAILLAVLAGCNSMAAPSKDAPAPPEVSVAEVLSRPVQQWDEFTGHTSAVETVELRPRISGYVDRVAYHEGDRVTKGQLLFAIDPRPYRAALQLAQANLERARSAAMLAASEARRAQTLVDAKAISRQEFDSRSAATAQSQATVHAAEAAVASARLDLQFTEVRSPINGRAGRARITAGNLAQADGTILTSVVSADPMYVYFDVDEQSFLHYGALARGGERHASGNPVHVGLADEAGFPHAATVDFLANSVDPATGTISARAVLRNPDGVFTPGLFARVQLQGSGRFDAILIDDKAVLTDQDRKYVYVLGQNNTVVRKDVVLGRSHDGLRIVTSGLLPGDQVVVNGLEKVFSSGAPVTPKVVAMGASEEESRVAVR